MKITVADVEHEFDPTDIRNDEAMALERACGMTFKEWGEALEHGSALALTGLVWILQRRDQPSLRFGDVNFSYGDLSLDEDAEPGPTETPEASASVDSSTSGSSPTTSASVPGSGTD